MKKGDIVMVYEDPLDEHKPEGKAELLKKLIADSGLECWAVRFIDDGVKAERWIQVKGGEV
jgi:hypothetical protein